MSSEDLHVIAVISNPAKFKTRINLFNDFVKHMLESGVTLHVVECVYNDLPPEVEVPKEVNKILVSAKTHVWIKENLINIGIYRLPLNWKYVAWIDGDLTFRRKDWAQETIYALQHFDIVQPWDQCYDLGPNDEHITIHNSFCRQWHKDPITCEKLGKGYTFAHPGYAWAATRHALETTGCLYESGILGAGDHHMALALIHKAKISIPGGVHKNYLQSVFEWQERALGLKKNLGYLEGYNIEHNFHGSKDNRRYVDRWQILIKHQYNPMTDVFYNVHGVMELCHHKPGLKRDLYQYFRQRNEDSNSL